MSPSLPTWLSLVYALVAGAASVLYGCYAVAVFCETPPKLSRPQRIHQWWFNFVGSLAGWAAAYGLLLKAYRVLCLSQPANLGLSHALLFVLAFAGITGHLPRMLFATFQVIDRLIAKGIATAAKPRD
jgi:hypothetical protein